MQACARRAASNNTNAAERTCERNADRPADAPSRPGPVGAPLQPRLPASPTRPRTPKALPARRSSALSTTTTAAAVHNNNSQRDEGCAPAAADSQLRMAEETLRQVRHNLSRTLPARLMTTLLGYDNG